MRTCFASILILALLAFGCAAQRPVEVPTPEQVAQTVSALAGSDLPAAEKSQAIQNYYNLVKDLVTAYLSRQESRGKNIYNGVITALQLAATIYTGIQVSR